jgi:TPP-dependent pyruvate/acetoin dehydrogenase alpha subunit
MDLNLVKRMYELTYTIRRFEQVAIEQYRLGNIRGYLHPYLGEEAIAVGTILALRPDDYIVSTHRGHGHALAKGHDPRRMFAELFGKATGYCNGRGGSMHVASLAHYNLGANGIVGGGIPIATGAALGIKRKGTDQVVLCFFSDGAANNGVFHESVNMAAIYQLPVIYILENNHYAVSTPIEQSARVKDLSVRATGYGIPGITLDGNDACLINEAIQEPLRRARQGEGPTLIECKTYRHGGHHINDPGLYMPKDRLEYWKAKDPLDNLRSHLLNAGMSEAEVEAINARVEQLLEEAVQFAIESPEPSTEELLAEIAGY